MGKSEKRAETALWELEEAVKHFTDGNGTKPLEIRKEFSSMMSKDWAFIRNASKTQALTEYAERTLENIEKSTHADTPYDIYRAFVNCDLLESIIAVLYSIKGFCEYMGKSWGGFLVSDDDNPMETAKNVCLYDDNSEIIAVVKDEHGYSVRKEKVSPIPKGELWFEKVLEAKLPIPSCSLTNNIRFSRYLRYNSLDFSAKFSKKPSFIIPSILSKGTTNTHTSGADADSTPLSK